MSENLSSHCNFMLHHCQVLQLYYFYVASQPARLIGISRGYSSWQDRFRWKKQKVQLRFLNLSKISKDHSENCNVLDLDFFLFRTGTPYTEQKTSEGTKKSRKKSQRQQPQMTNDGRQASTQVFFASPCQGMVREPMKNLLN